LAALFLFPALAHADAPLVPPDAQTLRQQVEAAPKRGLFYEVSDGTATLYLFGTIHAGRPEFYPLNSIVLDAFRSSKYLAIEADVSDQAANAKLIAEHAVYPDDDSLDRHVPPAVIKKLQPVLEKNNIPMAQMSKLKPWTVAMTLDYVVISQAGYSPAYGAEMFLVGAAKALNIPVVEVESMQIQVAIFENLTPSEQTEFLSNTLDEIVSGEGAAELRTIEDAWAHADEKALTKAFADSVAQLPPEAKFLDQKLIKDRNVFMTQRVDDYLHSGSQYFVAVGTGHLVGEDGIVARLRAKGYKVWNLQ
jgi:uncharacterized protein YbaP (TraB family)